MNSTIHRPRSHLRPRPWKTPAAAGFTMVELILSITISISLTSLAFGALLTVMGTQRAALTKAQLLRDAQLALDHLAHDFDHMGVGVPRGLYDDGIFGTAPANQLRPLVRNGKPTAIAFVGDLLYPNAELPGLARITDIDGLGLDVALTSDLGTCVPETSSAAASYHCSTWNTSFFDGNFTNADNCDGSNAWARSCPWALGKFRGQASQDSVYLTLLQPSGNWEVAQWDLSSFDSVNTDGLGIQLTSTYPTLLTSNISAANFINTGSGSGAIANIDRVFWLLDGDTLYRRQCWGGVYRGLGNTPGSASFPNVGDATPTRSTTYFGCTAPLEGTDWEAIIDNVASFQIRYFQDAATEQTGTWNLEKAARTRGITVDLTLRKQFGNDAADTVDVTMQRAFFIENRGGLDTSPATDVVNGGCVDPIDCSLE